MEINRDRLLERFLRYVQIDTTARDGQPHAPSSAGQLELGRIVAAELTAIGLSDVSQSEQGVVLATLAPTLPGRCPAIALSAHLDTSPETTGAGVRPQVVRHYAGGEIPLGSSGRTIPYDPQLAACHGHTLVTTDGTTLLGSDDKAGVAVIVETMAFLRQQTSYQHGPVRVCFTCDEEIGRGVDHVDVAGLGATVCYTLDGQEADEIDVETFSADLATVLVHGVNIHPSIGKGRMINALRVAASFVGCLAQFHSPETTEGREGFLHPYHVEGGVAEVTLRVLLRDFETAQLSEQRKWLEQAAEEIAAAHPGSRIEVHVRPQYRNMAEGLAREPRAVDYAVEALRRLGRTPRLTLVRGGTDGSRLTELGLPTPNLSTGQHNIHSPLEWASLDQMVAACEMLIVLLGIWQERS